MPESRVVARVPRDARRLFLSGAERATMALQL